MEIPRQFQIQIRPVDGNIFLGEKIVISFCPSINSKMKSGLKLIIFVVVYIYNYNKLWGMLPNL